MKKDYKRILYIIATTIFLITFCIFEIGLIIRCVNSYFNGTTDGLRFFGSQARHYGFEGVEDTITSWVFAMAIYFCPITIFQIIYIILFITIKIKSIKKYYIKEEKNEKRSKTINYVCLIMYLIILLFFPRLNILIIFAPESFRCNPDLIFAVILAITEAIFVLIIKKIAEINSVFSIILCSISLILFWLTLTFETWVFIPIFLIILSVLFIVSLFFIEASLKGKQIKN